MEAYLISLTILGKCGSPKKKKKRRRRIYLSNICCHRNETNCCDAAQGAKANVAAVAVANVFDDRNRKCK
jgi:hypothetical protein